MQETYFVPDMQCAGCGKYHGKLFVLLCQGCREVIQSMPMTQHMLCASCFYTLEDSEFRESFLLRHYAVVGNDGFFKTPNNYFLITCPTKEVLMAAALTRKPPPSPTSITQLDLL